MRAAGFWISDASRLGLTRVDTTDTNAPYGLVNGTLFAKLAAGTNICPAQPDRKSHRPTLGAEGLRTDSCQSSRHRHLASRACGRTRFQQGWRAFPTASYFKSAPGLQGSNGSNCRFSDASDSRLLGATQAIAALQRDIHDKVSNIMLPTIVAVRWSLSSRSCFDNLRP